MMFKQASCEEELFIEMQQAQDMAVIKEDNYKDILILQAMQELDLAAQNFEKIGKVNSAKKVSELMISLIENK